MLKKLLLILVVILGLCLCACGGDDSSDDITKPKINTVPPNWSMEEDSPYGSYEGDFDDTEWGLIDYTDQTDLDFVLIYYGDVPSALKGHENDEDALVERATLEATAFYTIDETGSMQINDYFAGYVKGYDPDTDVYDLEIVFVDGTTCVDIYACFDPTDDDEAEVMSLINSITME